jgi:TolB-like protein
MPARGKKTFCFNEFSLDLERGCLRREGRAIDLRPKSFELLRYLVENAGRLIPKDELVKTIWRRVVVSDESLARCVSDVRSVLGDADQRIIQTVPRRGYLFGAPVSVQAAAAVVPASTEPTIARAPHLSLVVLPFANLGEAALERFVDGVTDTLTTDLARRPPLIVVAASTALVYKGKGADVRAVGRDLGVRYAVEGSIQSEGERLRVNAQLIDAETGAHLWAERFDKRRTDLFDMQDEIAVRLARSIALEIVTRENRRIEAEPAQHLDAVDLSIRGLAIYWRPFSLNAARKARSYFEAALRVDELNVPALVDFARIHISEVACYVSGNPTEQLRIAEAAITKALSLEPDNVRVHDARARLLFARGEPEAALREFEFVISLDPCYPLARAYVGTMRIYLGRAEEAEAHLLEAIRLNPRDSGLGEYHFCLGLADLYLGRLAPAADRLQRSVEINPNFELTYFYLAAALALSDFQTEAMAVAATAQRLLPEFTVGRFRASPRGNNPVYLGQRGRIIEGMRKAGVPE